MPKVWRTGNAGNRPLVVDTTQISISEGKGYKANGTSPLTPRELRMIRAACIGSNTVEGLQLYVLILISFFCFP